MPPSGINTTLRKSLGPVHDRLGATLDVPVPAHEG